jgi:hypothetical protein
LFDTDTYYLGYLFALFSFDPLIIRDGVFAAEAAVERAIRLSRYDGDGTGFDENATTYIRLHLPSRQPMKDGWDGSNTRKTGKSRSTQTQFA